MPSLSPQSWRSVVLSRAPSVLGTKRKSQGVISGEYGGCDIISLLFLAKRCVSRIVFTLQKPIIVIPKIWALLADRLAQLAHNLRVIFLTDRYTLCGSSYLGDWALVSINIVSSLVISTLEQIAKQCWCDAVFGLNHKYLFYPLQSNLTTRCYMLVPTFSPTLEALQKTNFCNLVSPHHPCCLNILSRNLKVVFG